MLFSSLLDQRSESGCNHNYNSAVFLRFMEYKTKRKNHNFDRLSTPKKMYSREVNIIPTTTTNNDTENRRVKHLYI